MSESVVVRTPLSSCPPWNRFGFLEVSSACSLPPMYLFGWREFLHSSSEVVSTSVRMNRIGFSGTCAKAAVTAQRRCFSFGFFDRRLK